MRAALYARYSAGPRQTDQSIEGQIRDCTAFCEQRGFTVVEVYADRHISGKTDERPEFQRLIADSKKKKFDAVVVWKTDRFARNKYDSAIYKRQLKMNGIQIFYAKENIPDGPEGIILESLMEGLAEYYSAELAQKIKRGMRESALKGRVIGNSIPLGYRASKDHTYEIDPDGAKAVKTIFDMYINGDTTAEICRYLNSLGFKTSRGNDFNKNSVNRIIKNRFYIGRYEAAGIVIEGGVPQIISDETFNLAQAELKKRKTCHSTRKNSAEYLLTGKLFCGYCKKAMNGVSGTSRTGKRHYYYQCPNARAKKSCKKKPVPRDYIENLIIQLTVDYIIEPERLAEIAHMLYTEQQKNDTKEADLAYYKKRLAENKKAIGNILKAVESGLGTTSLLERLQALESEQTAIEGEMAYCKTKNFAQSEMEIVYYLREFLQETNEPWEEYRRRILTVFISKVFLYDDKLTILYRSPGDTEHIPVDVDLYESHGSSSGSSAPLKKYRIYGTFLFVRPRACFQYGVFRVPKNGILETNKPPAMQVSQHCFSLQEKTSSDTIMLVRQPH